MGPAAGVIRDYVVESFLLGADQGLGDDDSLIEAGVLDSTAVVEIVSFLEDEFSIQVEDEDLVPENLDSIARLDAFVQRKLAGDVAAPSTEART